nr:MAG TPA: hypothetical protein [Bacteriophage sp.]
MFLILFFKKNILRKLEKLNNFIIIKRQKCNLRIELGRPFFT